MGIKKCFKCKRELPADGIHFYTASNTKDKLHSSCKECEGHKFTTIPKPYEKKDHKTCPKCERTLPADTYHFYAANKRRDGLQHACKECDGHSFTKPVEKIKDGYKKCSQCNEVFPLTIEYFRLRKKGIDNVFLGQCKSCTTLNQQTYRRENRASVSANSKRYRWDNIIVITANKKVYNDSNKESIHEQCRQYRLINRERDMQDRKDNIDLYRERDRKYYQDNKEMINRKRRKLHLINRDADNERSRNYYHKNQKHLSDMQRIRMKGKANIYWQRRRAKEKSLPATLTEQQWDNAKDHFNNCCAYCGKEKPLERDHFLALSNDGPYTEDNIVPACKSCNSSKNDSYFSVWYPRHRHYAKKREVKVLRYLGYVKGFQQLSIA